MMALGTAVYAACVDFLLVAAAAGSATYRDANALLFFVLWPLVTVVLIGVVLWQRRLTQGPERRIH